MPPAARLTDMHQCPMITPGIPPIPHVGGPIIPPCEPTVLTGFLPQARITDMLVCVGPPDVIVQGATSVLVGGLFAARILDQCANDASGLLVRAAKAVALLELIQETIATDARFVAQVLYDRLDRGSNVLERWGVDPSLPYVMFVGRITRQKGVPYLLEAALQFPANTQLVLCAGAMFLSYRLQRSRTGRAWAAIREDEDAAQAMGINKTTTKLLAFAMGASTAGFSGVIFSGLQGFVSPESFVLVESVNILAMVVLGGMGSIPGVVLGALILTALPEVLREYAQYRFTIFGFGLTFMVLVRPEGLWPSRAGRVGRVEPPEAAPDQKAPDRPPASVREAPARPGGPPVEARALLGGREAAPTGGPVLILDGVSKTFGGLRAVRDVSFTVTNQQLMAVIGPNGAGKTTLFNLITGVYAPTSGVIRFHDRMLGGLRPDQVTARGIARTYQNIRLFKGMSVLDNILVGTHNWTRATALDAMLNTPRATREDRDSHRAARDLLDFIGIRQYESHLAMNLSYGDQRRLEIARAMATHPTLLLLDEPAAGMNPAETAQHISLIRRIRDLGITVMLVEHDMKVVMQVSENIVVLDHGEKIAEGGPGEIQRNDRVIEAYLGKVG